MSKGLSHQEATARLSQYGENRLPKAKRISFIRFFLTQFANAFIYVLLIAAIVCLLLNQFINAIFIFAVLLINALIGAIQEYSAQKAADALSHMVPQQTRVIRQGAPTSVDSSQLVPGDWVLLSSGDRIAADISLKQVNQFQVDESALTGESASISKSDFAYAGTMVTHGRGEGEVIATGASTEIGQIAGLVTQGKATTPPLILRIERFTLVIAIAILIIIVLIFALSLLRGAELAHIFLLGVALAVSAIPEGLPAAITVALAIGMKRMAKSNVIVRKLVAVESLGSCTFIASDKTGTLTVNEMTIGQVWLTNGHKYHIEGEGLSKEGGIHAEGQADTLHYPLEAKLIKLTQAGVLANEAHLDYSDGIQADGDGVDLAFLVLGHKLGLLPWQPPKQLKLYPYESEKGYCASLNQLEHSKMISVKGAVEQLLPMCQISAELQDQVIAQMHWMARHGYRVLAVAQGENMGNMALKDLELLGLVAMRDPLRQDAIEAVAQCQQANIKVAMITGDHPVTAQSLAQQLKLEGSDKPALTGDLLADAWQSEEAKFDALIAKHRVFARVKPEQKMQITQSLIRQGEFVAMTGDGVNDAPALKHAHVGIAMGKRGTDVARENAALVLTDDNFSSIVKGIIEGRVVYNNIRKVIFLLVSTGAAEILLFILSVLFALPIPLYPLQILWLNLVTNGIQDVALAFEPAEGDEFSLPPRRPKEPIFDRLMLERIIINACVMGVMAFILFSLALQWGYGESEARNLTLMLMVLFENIHALNSRSESRSLFAIPWLSNPILLVGICIAQGIHIGAMYTPGIREALELTPIDLSQWLTLLATASVLILVDEYHKKHWRVRQIR